MIAVQAVRGGPVSINPDLSRVSVHLRPVSGGENVTADVLQNFVGSHLVLLPRDLPRGHYNVVLTVDGQGSLPAGIEVVPVAFGLFARGRNGFGPALAQNLTPASAPRLNLFTDPARPGDYLILWGTGLGESTAADVTVEIAGSAVRPTYAGPSGTYPGLDQINVPLPAGTPDSCFVSVLVRAGDSVSNESTFSKAASAGACEDPFGFSNAELAALDRDQMVRLDSPAAGLGRAIFLLRAGESHRGGTIHVCGRLRCPREALRVRGPEKALDIPHPAVPVLYLSVLDPKSPSAPPFFGAGEWTISAPGGRTVAPFSISRSLPPPLRWTNRDTLAAAVDRAADQTILWAGDGYTSDGVMTVTLSSAADSPAGATAVMCRARPPPADLPFPMRC
jgi:uncharacterized protein (TIGR03437 family)